MNKLEITSIAEFHKQLGKLEGKGSFIYRGQSNTELDVVCSAARRLEKYSADKEAGKLVNYLLIGYLEFLIAKARMRGFIPSGLNENSTKLEFLAQLQHQGAATGLIDFTRQPLVALWFACIESNKNNGIVYALSDTETEEIDTHEKLSKDIQHFYLGDKLWLWEPSAIGNRIVAQSSVLIFGCASISPTKMEKFFILDSSKKSILAQLDTVYGINEESLFSDLPGYALANSSGKDFDPQRTISYWKEKIVLTSNDAERAQAHFYCGAAYSAIADFKKTVAHYSESLHFDPENAIVYGTRGIIKNFLGDPTAKQDFEQAIFLAKEQGNSVVEDLAQQSLDDLKKSENPPPKKD